MNIFYLDQDTEIAASYHCDKHVVKMILETCQILASVHHRYGNHDVTYKETHKNHPSTLWAGDSPVHYNWLVQLGIELCKEYTARYGKTHKCLQYLQGELADPPVRLRYTDDYTFVPPPQCMPDEYKRESSVNRREDTVEAYRTYYRGAKASIAKWKTGDIPTFMTDKENL